ncbi:MAG TPA: MBL fold metallo-hydrolase [Phycisphaerales bacterium]|nr:MBL fold metallo-hydrolase [Phycisphaerales bacterium]
MPARVPEEPDRSTARLERHVLGPWETNCYVVTAGAPAPGRPCWVVDAGFEPEALVASVRRAGLRPAALVLTHCHLDHIAGVNAVLGAFPDAMLLVHRDERDWLTDAEANLSALIGMPVTARAADRLLDEGDRLTLDGLEFEVRHVPGHSPGSIALYQAESGAVISGDALFAGSIGRTDFPGSDFETLDRSIRARLYTLPDETRVYPGHGPETTIGREKRGNPFVRG